MLLQKNNLASEEKIVCVFIWKHTETNKNKTKKKQTKKKKKKKKK